MERKIKIKVHHVKDVFNVESGKRITEEEVYHNFGKMPIVTAKTTDRGITWYADKQWLKIKGKIYKDMLLTWNKEGYAGKLFFRDYPFFPIDVCGILIPKPEYSQRINLKWFLYSQQGNFYKNVYSRATQGKLYHETTSKIKFNLIPIKKQNEMAIKYEKVMKLIDLINRIKLKMQLLMNTKSLIRNIKYSDRIGKIFNIIGGNNGLTEEFIYYNQPTNEDEKIDIFSSATSNLNLMGSVSKNSKPNEKKLKIFKSPCILVARNGYAGTMNFIQRGKFTTNDHAYVIIPKKEWKNKINLRWFAYQYQELFYNLVTSKSDNATFNKDYAERQVIKLPEKKVQDEIAGKLLKIDNLLIGFSKITSKLNDLMEFEIK